jgi:hypothetical protein
MPQIPVANTIRESTITEAYVYEDREARAYIRAYGRLRASIFNELIKEPK